MKRTKEWWAQYNAQERSLIVQLERANKKFSSRGGYLPDDCSECTYCGQPHMSWGLCMHCERVLSDLLDRNRIIR